MQSGDRKKMNRAGLLEFLFQFHRAVAQTKNDSANQAVLLGCVLQAVTECRVHHSARSLCGAEKSVGGRVPENPAILRIARDERGPDVMTREISPHIKFARIAWTFDRHEDSEKLHLVAVGHVSVPARQSATRLSARRRGLQSRSRAGGTTQCCVRKSSAR